MATQRRTHFLGRCKQTVFFLTGRFVVLSAIWWILTATGLAAGLTGERLEKVLVGRNDVLRARTIGSIDVDYASRLSALPQMSSALKTLVERLDEDDEDKPVPAGIASLITCLAKIDKPQATDSLTTVLGSPAVPWVSYTADRLGYFKHREAIDPLMAAFESPLCKSHYGLRFIVARSLLQMEDPDAYEKLGRLKQRTDGQLRHKLDVELQKLTVEDFRNDQERFERFRSGEFLQEPLSKKFSKDSMFKSASYSESKNRMRLTRQKYYDIDIYAKRLLFVIDRSGSMQQVGYRGTRLQKAKQELIAAIKGLEGDTEFGILVFDTKVRAYKPELLPASDENKRNAIRFVGKLTPGDRTNTYGAMRQAIEFDDNLEAIFVLTDGMPTTGDIIAPPKILADILSRNEFRNITINTVAVAADVTMQGFLKGMTEPSGGEFRAVR